jgi:hypothetical protein
VPPRSSVIVRGLPSKSGKVDIRYVVAMMATGISKEVPLPLQNCVVLLRCELLPPELKEVSQWARAGGATVVEGDAMNSFVTTKHVDIIVVDSPSSWKGGNRGNQKIVSVERIFDSISSMSLVS